jgi:excisionase family DNA binding protein
VFLNTNGEIPVDIITKYEFNIRINSLNTLLFFSYNIVEIKTNIEINNLNNNKDLLEIKELIDNKFYLKKEIISTRLVRDRKRLAGRNPEIPFDKEYKSDSTYEFMILLQLMKKLDKRLDLIEKAVLSNTSTLNKQDNIKFDEKVLSIDEVSKLLGLAKATIYSKASRKELPHMKRGNKLYFSEKEINEYLKGGKILSNDEIDAISKNYLSNSSNKKK